MSLPSLTDWMTHGAPTDADATTARAEGRFAANLMRRSDGVTLSVWTHTVATALPKTDFVALQDDEGVSMGELLNGPLKHDVIFVKWDALAAHLGPRLRQHGERYYVDPEDFPDEETRSALGRPLLAKLDTPFLQEDALLRLMPIVREDPAIVARAHELGELPVMLLVDPTEEFDLQRLESAPVRVELKEQIVLVFLGRIEERVVYSAEPWPRLLPTN